MTNLFIADIKRYKNEVGFVFYEPSIIIVFFFRLRKWLYSKNIIIKIIPAIIVEPLYFFLTLLFGIHLPKSCEIGPGLIIHHFGGIVINHKTRIGANCTLRHNVTIGNRKTHNDVPIIGDNVNIGVGAVILGDIKVGNNVSIGANAVVLIDVPDNCIAVGNPARIILKTIKQ
jgi:serine O-acetyltransferase